ncbi:MAG: hypothetical protein OEL83_15185 [Desulforhopalus sp.]|nr:hypothetical protein [Desulforhopalus sp.]
MNRLCRLPFRGFPASRQLAKAFFLCIIVCLLPGCVANVQIPTIEQFQLVSAAKEENIDTEAQRKLLLDGLYQLLKTNEGLEIPVCTATRESRECTDNGFGVFVLGGPIPGTGGRTVYVFSKISLSDNQLEFTKDNRGTTFIGTPMYVMENQCQAKVVDGGMMVTMPRYYASWMGVGQMFMAEGWAIDYIDLSRGIVGLQMELDIKGLFTVGGGSRYLLLKFPKIPDESIKTQENPGK